MRLYFRQLIAILLLAGLGMILAIRGIVPAISQVDTDFPNYFTAAKIVANGGDLDRLYDDRWFQEQMRHYQIGRQFEGKFSPFPRIYPRLELKELFRPKARSSHQD